MSTWVAPCGASFPTRLAQLLHAQSCHLGACQQYWAWVECTPSAKTARRAVRDACARAARAGAV